jgi:predicted PurR-regulated permease PerM
VLALLQLGGTEALLVLAGYIALNQFFGSFVEPYLLGQRLRLAPLAVLVSVIVWGWIWGAAGALLSVPITMALKIGLEHSDEFRWIAQLLEGQRPGATGTAGR